MKHDQLRTELERFKIWQSDLDRRHLKRRAILREKTEQQANLDDWMTNQMKGVTTVADINILKLTENDKDFLVQCGIGVE